MKNMCGKNNPFFGKHHTDTTKSLLSKANFKTGYSISTGYIRNNKTKQLFHREIMEKNIGRKLYPEEIIHHINEDRKDNRIENLMIVSRKQHIIIHKKKSEYRVCQYCRNQFSITPHKPNVFCSRTCSDRSKIKVEFRKCINCGSKFICKPSDPKIKCSRQCHLKYIREKYKGE